MNIRSLSGFWFQVVLALACAAGPMLADTTGKSDNFYYTDNGTSLTITGIVTKPVGALDIPSTLNGKTVTSIAHTAFYKCSSLTSVTIPSSVASITCRVNGDTIVDDGDTNCQTFSNCSALVSIEVDAANPNFSSTGGILFDKLQTTLIQYPPGKVGTYTIPANVSSIWPLAFDRCNGLPSISVDASNPSYSSVDGVLFNKLKDKLVRYPAGKVGAYTIPSSVTSVKSGAFRNCKGLSSVTVPASVRSLGCFQQAFDGCSALTTIEVKAGNPYLSSGGGVLFDKLKSTLIQCPQGKLGSYTIPHSVTIIWNMAFDGCCSLTSVTIPSSVTNIKPASFQGCSGLKSVTIPSSVTSIEFGAFNNCSGLTSVTIPAGVTNIGGWAFVRCSGLKNVTIPSSVISIGLGAFNDCSGLTRAEFLGNAPTMESRVFDNTARAFTVYYHSGKTGFNSPTWNGYPASAVP